VSQGKVWIAKIRTILYAEQYILSLCTHNYTAAIINGTFGIEEVSADIGIVPVVWNLEY